MAVGLFGGRAVAWMSGDNLLRVEEDRVSTVPEGVGGQKMEESAYLCGFEQGGRVLPLA